MIPTLLGAIVAADSQQFMAYYVDASAIINIPTWANYVDIISIDGGDAGDTAHSGSTGGSGGDGGDCRYQADIPTIGNSQIKCEIALGGSFKDGGNGVGGVSSVTWGGPGGSSCLSNPVTKIGGRGGLFGTSSPYYGGGGGAPGSEKSDGSDGMAATSHYPGQGASADTSSIIGSFLGSGKVGLTTSQTYIYNGNPWGGGGGGGCGTTGNGYGTEGGHGGVYLLFKAIATGGLAQPPS